MKTPGLIVLIVATLASQVRAASDTIVTFNEVMYHPATNEPAMEWVELYNQMSYDMDLSSWRLDDGIDFTFPEGTLIRGRSYLVVASDPAALQAATGLTGVLGPFTSRLSNAGETIELKNNNGRLMDRLSYGTEFDWPVGPDGAGPSLAKVNPTASSGDVTGWSASLQVGGSPGGRNFVPAGTFTAPPGLISYWNFNETNAAVNDLVGGNNGTPGAGALRVNGLVGRGAFALNSTSNAFIHVGSGVANNFSTASGIAIEALIRPGWNGTGNATLFRKEEPVLGTLVGYWSFDEASSGSTPAVDAVGGNNGSFIGTATRVPGLVGLGAARFNNAGNDGVNVGAGVNNSFSMSTGITVFARFRPTWSGGSGDYDEIFRKEDGGNRILLSFQNDANNGAATPPVSAGPVLSFGLNVNGAYSELDMPLDGVAGRPTLAQLADGATHSIAATYDSISGRKAIWIDGTMRWSVTLSGPIASGGGAAAVIGNINTGGGEPFSGTIDDFAIWRAALAPNEIASLASGSSPLTIGAAGNPAASTRLLLGFQNDGNNAAAIPPVAPGPVLSFGLNIGGVYSELDLPLDGANGRPALAQFTNGQMHHVVATYDQASGVKAIYVDGSMRFSNLHSGPISSGGNAAAVIGNASAPGGEPFTGTLDEVAFWNRALTATEVARHAAATQMGQDYFANVSTTNRALLGFAATWRYEQSGTDLGTTWRAPAYNDAAWSSGPGLLADETCGCLAEPIRTTLATNEAKTTFYFRTHFNFTGNVAEAQLALRHIIDDGAIVYLNGAEVWRVGLPAGDVTFATLASRGVDNATLEGPFSIPATNLVLGDNVLAVEVHQTAASSSDVVFGLALDAVETVFVPGGSSFATEDRSKIAFNELVSSTNANFWFELVNHGASEVNLGGYVLARLGGTNRSYVFPSQTVAANSFLQVTKATIGFGVDSGDKLVLYAPDGLTVIDAVVAKKEPRGRNPAATGPWQFTSAPTPTAANVFAVHDEIVINEIMYHHRPLPAVPAVYGPTNMLLGFTNEWRYQAQGFDLGTAWSAAGYDDSAWPVGAALLYNSPSTFPVPKNTLMSATNAAGTRIITYYFRTTFNWAGGTNPPLLSLRAIVDDGAIYYLNGVEVLRQNLPAGNVTSSTVAATPVGVATFSGPFAFPAASLVAGVNTLAVEVHRVSTVDNDVVFGAELSASTVLSPGLPRRDSPEAWVELFNRSGNAVDLTGWRLDEGIDYRFPSGKALAPGGYLVVAKDPDYLLTLYPGLDVVGPFTNKLSKSGDFIVLKDANNNPANSVRYFDGGRWPEAADGGGASLELRDPWADNSKPEAWAASDEGSKSSWVWYTNRAVAVSSLQPPTTYNEFVLGLLDAGECLIDDLRVVESPTNTPISLLQNGTFSSGLNAWRIVGNQYGSVLPDPLNPGNNVLRLLADGPTEYLHNHAETTLKNGAAIYAPVNGRTYEVSFRAKWISGNNLLNTRLWMNRVARTFELAVPALNGTPGGPNSRLVPNLGPTFANLRHTRTVPLAGEPVTVNVEATDAQGVAVVTLHYSVNSGAWNTTPMNTTGDNRFAGTVPGAAAGAVVNFYVQAADALGAVATFPAAGTNSRALYQVNDGRALLNLANNVRIVVTPRDSDSLHQPTNMMSNGRLGSTVIWNEEEVYYDMGVRLKGSEHGRPDPNRLGFFLDFRPDQLFRGVHSSIGVDRSGGWRFGTTFGQDEIVIKHIISHAGGLPQMYDDLIRVITPRAEHTGPAILQMARYGAVFLDSHYQDGGNGTAFEYELLYDASGTTGGAEGLKLPQESSAVGVPLASLGDDKESYRLNFIIKNNRDADDYSKLITALKALGQPAGAVFDAATEATLDVDEWLRAYAASSLCGPGDNNGGDNAQHNLQLYTRPEDNKTLFMIWDTDFAFVRPATESITVNTELNKFIANPANRRRYYEHLLDIITTTYNTAYMGYWTDHYDNFLPGQNFSAILAYIGQRASFVMGQLPTNAAFSITSNGGADFATTNGTIVLGGTAPLHVRFIEIDGVRYPLTWTIITNWTLTLPLYSGINSLVVQGVDRAGLRRTNFTDTITVTNNGPGALLPVVINEWMVDNRGPGGLIDAADGLFQDWFELFNPNGVAANLSGFHLTDTLNTPTKWQIPTNVFISARGYLLVWADNNVSQNPTAGGTNVALHANFQLSNGGEAIALYSPGGVLQHSVTFGAQSQNISQGLFPDGNTNATHSMTNWTPRTANTLAGLIPPQLHSFNVAGGVATLELTVMPGRTYQLQFKDDLASPTWTPAPLGTAVRANGPTLIMNDLLDGAVSNRFYRVVLLP